MTQSLSCFVPGKPVCQAGVVPLTSATTKRTIVVSKGGKGFSSWRKSVTQIVGLKAKLERVSFPGPVRVDLIFLFDRPKSNTDKLPSARWCGDKDKLERAIYDSLTKSGVIQDDSYICAGFECKRWAELSEESGVIIKIMEL